MEEKEKTLGDQLKNALEDESLPTIVASFEQALGSPIMTTDQINQIVMKDINNDTDK